MSRTHRRLGAIATAVGMVWGGSSALASVPDPPEVDPADLAFLDTPVIDELIAASENGDVDCAALNGILYAGLIAGFSSMDDDTDEHAPEFFFAVTAPMLVPLLQRVSVPDDAELAEGVDQLRVELGGAVVELGDLGFTEDDILFLQEGFARSIIDPDTDFGSDVDTTELEDRLAALEGTDFESITFLDEDDGTEDDNFPWSDSCPETVTQFDLSFDDAATSVTVQGEELSAPDSVVPNTTG